MCLNLLHALLREHDVCSNIALAAGNVLPSLLVSSIRHYFLEICNGLLQVMLYNLGLFIGYPCACKCIIRRLLQLHWGSVLLH